MTISAGPLTPESTTPFHALAPLRFPPNLRLTPEQFAPLCAENREAVLELAADGQVLAITPAGSETGATDNTGYGRCSSAPVASVYPTVRCSDPRICSALPLWPKL